jgi:hypothetical protein
MTTPASAAIDDDRAPAPRFLVIDSRVPETIRQLLEEADGCLNMSFTVGGTACARRAIRVILDTEAATGESFAVSLLALKDKYPGVPPTLFQILELLAAGDEPLQTDQLKALIATTKSMVYEIYVLGAERIESLEYLSTLLKTLDRNKAATKLPPRVQQPAPAAKPRV